MKWFITSETASGEWDEMRVGTVSFYISQRNIQGEDELWLLRADSAQTRSGACSAPQVWRCWLLLFLSAPVIKKATLSGCFPSVCGHAEGRRGLSGSPGPTGFVSQQGSPQPGLSHCCLQLRQHFKFRSFQRWRAKVVNHTREPKASTDRSDVYCSFVCSPSFCLLWNDFPWMKQHFMLNREAALCF